MKEPRFQLATAPLENGRTLLEAGAGTGKTYTLAGLVLRLLLERRLLISEILVVTFTEAATAELRLRIRQLLVDAREAFVTGRSSGSLLARYATASAAERANWRAQLQAALESFDEAPVLTIHGFCQRILQEQAFETGSRFARELTPDPTPLLREIADNFWRRHFYAAPELEVLFARAAGLDTDAFLALLRVASRHGDFHVEARTTSRTLSELTTELSVVFSEARSLWLEAQREIKARFGAAAAWANKPYNRADEMAVYFDQLHALFTPGRATVASAKALAVFASSALLAKQNHRAKLPVPVHPFFDRCEQLGELQKDYASRIQAELLAEFPQELHRLRERDQTFGFDDLLTRLRSALRGSGGDALRARLSRQYRAVLIDEFQDTDPAQFEIFDRAFGGADHPVYLVGDPKQAIYSFRGADVFAYLRAHERVTRSRTLGENFRSEAALVAAVNAVFSPPQNRRPFALEEIRFQPVAACGQAEATPLTEQDLRLPPLQLWFWEPPADLTQKEPQQRAIAEAVATEIVRLLSDDVRRGNARVRPGDLAVLVDTHAQAELVATALSRRCVPAVLQTQQSVWKTPEATELERVLVALAEPGRDTALRGALATTLLGVDAGQLAKLETNEVAWTAWRSAFSTHAQRWEAEGFLPMFEALLREHEVRSRLLALADGERRLTNLGQLAELLHAAASERRLGPLALGLWLSERRASEEPAAEDSLLRLERDDAAVQLVTIHRSKGLEYPIVFCPFLLRPATARNSEPAIYHDPTADFALTLDLGTQGETENLRRMLGERFAENLRLTYVALTRAKHRCYVVWGQLKGAENAALGWLLHPAPAANEATLPDIPEVTADHVKAMNPAQRRADVEALAIRAVDTAEPGLIVPPIEVRDFPGASEQSWAGDSRNETPLQMREFRGEIARDWGITSFTGLTTGRRGEESDRDAVLRVITPLVDAPASGPLADFRGVRAGICLHAIFETLDFAADEAVLLATVTTALREHGFLVALAEPVAHLIEQTLHHILPTGFPLAQISASDRVSELEFHLPLRKLTPETLRRVFARHVSFAATSELSAIPGLERLQFRPLQGFLRGFMDLVFRFAGRFWLVDWKSNWLGATASAYDAAGLAREMEAEHYGLQYHLYTVALDAWLRRRLPGYQYERDFGGVFYLFVRAVGADPQRPELGVVYERPAPSLITDLRQTLLTPTDFAT